jgi:cell shape-determining protein MreC
MTKPSTSSPWLAAAILLAGAVLLCVPVDSSRAARARVRDALLPGQSVVRLALTTARSWPLAWRSSPGQGRRIHELEDELKAARLENRRLNLQTAELNAQLQKLAVRQGIVPPTATQPLMTAQLVEARVLGEETASLWRSKKQLSAGSRDGLAESSLVLDDTRPLVDLGNDTGLSSGDAVYAGRIVIGKIAEVGRFSSTLRLVTDPGYSGRARLARHTSRGLAFGAEGTLTGDGSSLCRLKHISDPVAVGDEVFTGGSDGLIPYRMYYGKVVRAELESGSQEWQVWVEPALATERLEKVLVLRRAANPDRILAN